MRHAKIVESLRKLKASGLPVSTVVDVGIQHSTPVLIDVFKDVPHVLFEPISEYYPHIRRNYADIVHVLVEAAVSDYDGSLIIHSEKKTRGDEISHSYLVNAPTSSSRTVRSVTLDAYFAQIPINGSCLLKVDVEGPDVPSKILMGARSFLKQVSAVIVEMTVDKFVDRSRVLDDAGFDLWDLCDLCYYGDCLWQADAIFIRRDLKTVYPSLAPMHIRPFRSELWQSGF